MDPAVRGARVAEPVAFIRVRGQPVGPAHAACRRTPRRGQPRSVVAAAGPQVRLAHRGMVDRVDRRGGRDPSRGAPRVSRSLELYRSLPRYLASRAVSSKLPGMGATSAAPLRLTDGADPAVPDRPGWVRVRVLLSGICGSDLATVTGRSSLYFSPLVSWPFVPGHEVVGVLEDRCDDLPSGTRVVLDPVLTCAARGLPPCAGCSSGRRGRCDQVATGHLVGWTADRLLRRHRWRMGSGAGGAPLAAARRSRRLAGRSAPCSWSRSPAPSTRRVERLPSLVSTC